jgi:hypothetical protein
MKKRKKMNKTTDTWDSLSNANNLIKDKTLIFEAKYSNGKTRDIQAKNKTIANAIARLYSDGKSYKLNKF